MTWTKKKFSKLSKIIVTLFFLKTTHYRFVLILNKLKVDIIFLNSIKFLFKLIVLAVNIIFFNDGQQINGSTEEL